MTKTMAKRFLHTWFAIIALLRVGETFLMQLHRSRPEPRLSTFERCWLGGATRAGRGAPAAAQRPGDTRDLFALRSPDQSARSASASSSISRMFRRSVSAQKRQQIFETVPVRHRGTSFRSAKLF